VGLDWNPLSRPKPGAEAEFERLVALSLDKLSKHDRKAAAKRFEEITDAPFETLGAPRVGSDPQATEWLLAKVRENGDEERYAEILEQMRGYYVLDLLPECPGLPIYTSEGYEGVDRYTFRGKFLDFSTDIIGKKLYNRAWERMSARELHDYGEALLDAGRKFARKHKLQYLENQRQPPDDDPKSRESKAHIVFSAAAWCLWWSDRGHGLEPYA